MPFFKLIQTKMENKKFIAGAVGLLAVGGLAGSLIVPTQVIEVEKLVNQTVEVPVVETVIVETIVEKEVIKEVNVTQEVLVDNKKLTDVLNHIYDNNGDVEYLLDNLDDDEVILIADRVIFVNEMKKFAVDAVKSELFDELDREEYNISGIAVEFDESDLERLRIDNDEDEIEVIDVDFEDGDITLRVTGSFEQDDDKYAYTADVEFKDGYFDQIDNILVEEY